MSKRENPHPVDWDALIKNWDALFGGRFDLSDSACGRATVLPAKVIFLSTPNQAQKSLLDLFPTVAMDRTFQWCGNYVNVGPGELPFTAQRETIPGSTTKEDTMNPSPEVPLTPQASEHLIKSLRKAGIEPGVPAKPAQAGPIFTDGQIAQLEKLFGIQCRDVRRVADGFVSREDTVWSRDRLGPTPHLAADVWEKLPNFGHGYSIEKPNGYFRYDADLMAKGQ